MAIASFFNYVNFRELRIIHIYDNFEKKGGSHYIMDPKELDLVEQSAENEVLDDFGFSEAYGYSYDEYEEEWN